MKYEVLDLYDEDLCLFMRLMSFFCIFSL